MDWLIDCHFHPCFLSPSRRRRWRKCLKCLERFDALGLHAVIVTEHAWRNAEGAFNLIHKANREIGSPTLLIPGIEAFSKEGVDLIVYGRDMNFYRTAEKLGISKPREHSLPMLIQLVDAEPTLQCYLPHPRGLSKTSVFVNKNTRDMDICTDRFEKVNGSFFPLAHKFRHVTKPFPKMARRLHEAYHYRHNEQQLIFAGSDAHRPRDLNRQFALTIETDRIPTTVEEAFDLLNKPEGRSWSDHTHKTRISTIAAQSTITFCEFLIKRRSLWQT